VAFFGNKVHNILVSDIVVPYKQGSEWFTSIDEKRRNFKSKNALRNSLCW
jgi:hypothetical protein